MRSDRARAIIEQAERIVIYFDSSPQDHFKGYCIHIKSVRATRYEEDMAIFDRCCLTNHTIR